MINDEVSNEFANLYDQLRYNLEYLRSYVVTVDAVLRTMLAFQELAEPLDTKMHDGQHLPDTREVVVQVDLMLAVIREKAAQMRRENLPGFGPVN